MSPAVVSLGEATLDARLDVIAGDGVDPVPHGSNLPRTRTGQAGRGGYARTARLQAGFYGHLSPLLVIYVEVAQDCPARMYWLIRQ
jgi:hypothetical protein